MHDGERDVLRTAGRGGRTRRRALVVASMAALVWVILARVTGPTDLWEQAQRHTISYTTDILVHGRWILPRERGEVPATKPPLYNWLAAPAVRGLGFASEPAHKLPSLVALALCWLLVVRVGRRLDPEDDAVGWLAGIAFVANYLIFKLGYLARPDMLLTLWIAAGWALATSIIVEDDGDEGGSSRWRAFRPLAFWLCVGLAGLTKGPACLVLLAYVLVAARPLGGSWRTFRRFGWWWGVPLGLGVPALWIAGAWSIDADHVRDQLWLNEIWGRITGAGPEGSAEKHVSWIGGLPYMPSYFLLRFGPWSVLALATMVDLVRRRGRGRPRTWRRTGPAGRRLAGAATFVLIVIGLFTLSTGKRADYLAPAMPAAALLAGWWLARLAPRRLAGSPWPAAGLAALTLGVLSVLNARQPQAPAAGFSRGIERFIDEAAAALDTRPREPVLYLWTGVFHVQALLGSSQSDGLEQVIPRVERGESFWVVAGEAAHKPRYFQMWLRRNAPAARVELVVESALNPKSDRWSQQMRLYFVRSGATAESAEAEGRPPGRQ
ncbi:MAG: hypothetical protein ACYTGG_01330 [Planctomycetota bacterium]|jgi:4-amino-4-deoxy-L-arabinose transferase-like glycosyltransferase